MLQSNSGGGEEESDFKWGSKKAVGRKNKNVHFYESFTYKGIQYQLFECAYFLVPGQCETSIGKLARMYETPTGEKKVKVVWFFRPIDIHSFLGEYEPQWDELFLACGDDAGVYNINDVEAIMGKCNVLCISNDPRNPRPARRELRNANYVFSRTFDTRLKIVSEDFADAIAGIRVESFFNEIRDKQPLKCLNSSAAASSSTSPVKSFHAESGSTQLGKNGNRDGKLTSRTSPVKKDLFLKERAGHVHVKNNPLVDTDITTRGQKTKTRTLENSLASGSSVDPRPTKMRKLIINSPETDDSGPQPGEERFIKNPPIVDKVPSHKIDKSSWYKKLPFEEELKAAIEKDRVLLIENLEPSYTLLEVEDLCWQAFNQRVDAKMIPATRNTHNGRALVIFQTTKAADSAMSRLTEGCLMLPDQRPLVGSRYVPKEVGESRSFAGHLSLVDKALMSIQKRKAVSTSHCAQPNHIVHHMALEWHALHAKSELQWKRLFEEQAKDINNIKSQKHQETRG